MSERSAKERNRRVQTPRLKQRGSELLHQYNMLNAQSRHQNTMAFMAMQANSWEIANTRMLNTITHGTSFQQVPAWKPVSIYSSLWGIVFYGWLLQMDTSQSDNTRNQANAALDESNRVFAELSNLEKEWKMFWEWGHLLM